MATQALYLAYRPQVFEDVVGQEPITRTLRNALRQGRVRHAYLFTGPRGTGKTTTARLLAKAVNCLASEEQRPCNECSICVAINEGRLLDLIEIDAASNRGIDEIRDIREKVGFRPNEGRYKVYVLDEAHMLTEPAFNALLKTLEEPPPHVIFTLVTTDPHKIPATITSRCQRFDFKRVPLQAMLGRLAYIAEQEGVTIEPAALELIAHQGTGAVRDAISLLDQLISYGDEIKLDQVQMVLGTVASEAAGKLVTCLVDGDVAGGLDLINRAVSDGADPRQFGREVVEYLRGLLLIREGAGTRLLNATAEQAADMESLSERVSVDRLLRAIRLFNEAATDLRRGLQTLPQLALEMALVESSLEPEALQLAGPSIRQQEVSYEVGGQSTSSAAEPATRPAAEVQTQPPSPTPDSVPSAQVESPIPEQMPAVPAGQSAVGTLTLAHVQQAWDQILQAVRQRNPATQAALNTGCLAVEVNGDEIVVTFPYPVLREKLGAPQRKAEIQDALDEVLHARCRVKLVLASEYKSNPRASSQSRSPVPATQGPAQLAQDVRASANQVVPDPVSGDQASDNQEAADQVSNNEVPEAISRWAEEHGGEAKVIPS